MRPGYGDDGGQALMQYDGGLPVPVMIKGAPGRACPARTAGPPLRGPLDKRHCPPALHSFRPSLASHWDTRGANCRRCPRSELNRHNAPLLRGRPLPLGYGSWPLIGTTDRGRSRPFWPTAQTFEVNVLANGPEP